MTLPKHKQLDENEIDYHNHGYYNEYDENWGRGMGMH